MTDLEMTRLCAEAMGYHASESLDEKHWGIGILALDAGKSAIIWRPLSDGSQAMALVAKFGITLDPAEDEPPFTWRATLPPWYQPSVSEDGSPNRAIVECVAKMHSAKR